MIYSPIDAVQRPSQFLGRFTFDWWVCVGVELTSMLTFNHSIIHAQVPVFDERPDIELCLELWPDNYYGNLYFLIANLLICYVIPMIMISICYTLIWIKVSWWQIEYFTRHYSSSCDFVSTRWSEPINHNYFPFPASSRFFPPFTYQGRDSRHSRRYQGEGSHTAAIENQSHQNARPRCHSVRSLVASTLWNLYRLEIR